MNPVSKDSIKCAWTTAKFLSLKEVKEETYYLTRKKKVEEEKKKTVQRTRTINYWLIIIKHKIIIRENLKFELFFFSVFINMG